MSREGRLGKEASGGPGLIPAGLLHTNLTLGLLLLAATLVILFYKLEARNRQLQANLSRYQAQVSEAQVRTLGRVGRVEQLSRTLVQEAAATLHHQSSRTEKSLLDTSRRLVSSLAREEEQARRKIRSDLAKAHEEIAGLRTNLSSQLREERRRWGRFREIQQTSDPSIFLIHSEFTYETREDQGATAQHTGSGWGTGFAISAAGYLVTNKHVVQPWKFDPELAAMAALGELFVKTQSLKLTAWQAGSRCLDSDRNLLTRAGYKSFGKHHRLWLYALARDHMEKKEMDLAGATVHYSIHRLDNNDLAILKIDGLSAAPIPCYRQGSKTPLAKLDPVMALGFPRGRNGLEQERAETSASLGTVRKVEETIHVTASIIPGNSGGPLLDQQGHVVGIVTRIYSETLGICIKIQHALDLLQRARMTEKAASLSPTGTRATPLPWPIPTSISR